MEVLKYLDVFLFFEKTQIFQASSRDLTKTIDLRMAKLPVVAVFEVLLYELI